MSKLRKAEKAENWSQIKINWSGESLPRKLGGPTENWNSIWSGESLPKKSDRTGWSASGVCTGCPRRGHTT